ncbi:MAG: CdaR family protein [Acidobacteria bacterium]|nr:CdaR family protein [Acidobacteriota bacterium]
MRMNLRHNALRKAISLALAGVCWIVVSSEEDRVKDFSVPIVYTALPENLELAGEVIDTVAVRLRGAEPTLRDVTADRLTARIDLSEIPLGEQYVQINAKMIKAPPGATVVRIEPGLIPLHVEKRLQREIPVVAVFAGRPPPGHKKRDHVIDPAVVTIEGPASEVARVKRATTSTISLEGETQDYDIEVTPIPEAQPGSRVRVVRPTGPVRVHVSIDSPESGRRGESLPSILDEKAS